MDSAIIGFVGGVIAVMIYRGCTRYKKGDDKKRILTIR